jgi:serine/threonine protein kinase
MKWPQHLDYIEAIQHPSFCLAAPALRQARPICDRFGVPRAAAGNFACVFQLENGTDRWAIRCFTRAAPNLRRRYSTLTRYLSAARLPSLVEFSYLEEGIRIRGTWHPILKMEWVEGLSLVKYVEAHLDQPLVLHQLLDTWEKVARDLRNQGIAHGDLQHGNILVSSDGRIRLVDYDAMYVPTFRGELSPELGHPNWQHPGRTERDYDPDLDGFADLVLQTSLAALALDPTLWKSFHNGENLIFTRQDFEDPRRSPLILRLRQSRERPLQLLLNQLEAGCIGSDARARPSIRSRLSAKPDLSLTRDRRPRRSPVSLEIGAADSPQPWAGARQLYRVARAQVARLIGMILPASRPRIASRDPPSATPTRSTSRPAPSPASSAVPWWKEELPALALPSSTPSPRGLRERMRDADFALLVWVCAICGILDAIVLTVWLF